MLVTKINNNNPIVIGLSNNALTLYNEIVWYVNASILENKIKDNKIAGLFKFKLLAVSPITEHIAKVAIS